MPQISRHPLGNTGIDVPVLSLGAGQHRIADEEQNIAAVHRAIELGMNYVDASPRYGNGQSQIVLGRALAGVRDPYILATKVGHFAEISNYRDEEAILKQIHDNLRVLQCDHIDVLQIHEAEWRRWWANTPPYDRTIEPDEMFDFADAPVMRALRRARQQGLCRFIGITGNTTLQLMQVLRHVEVDTILLAYNYNLIYRATRRHALPLAIERGVAPIVAGPLYGGRLAAVHREWLDNPLDWMRSNVRDALSRLYDIQAESGISLPELAIRYLLKDSEIASLLTGARSVAEVEQNVAFAEAGPLPHHLHQAIEELGVNEVEVHSWLIDFYAGR